MDKPYVRSSIEQLEILPLLSHKSIAVVWLVISLFEADPLGASKRDVLDYTQLSRHTVEEGLRALELSGLVHFTPETRRYRPNPKYVSFAGQDAQDVRGLVPILQRQPVLSSTCPKPAAKSHDVDVCTHHSEKIDSEHHHDWGKIRDIFADSGFEGQNLIWLSDNVSLDVANVWAEWVQNAPPERYRSPHGYCWTMLRENPTAMPPALPAPVKKRRALTREDYNNRQWGSMGEANRQAVLAGEMFEPLE